MVRMNHSSKEHLVSMKPTKHGNKFRITYRCPNYPDLIHESFDTEEEDEASISDDLGSYKYVQFYIDTETGNRKTAVHYGK